jgi:hypothetical protein
LNYIYFSKIFIIFQLTFDIQSLTLELSAELYYATLEIFFLVSLKNDAIKTTIEIISFKDFAVSTFTFIFTFLFAPHSRYFLFYFIFFFCRKGKKRVTRLVVFVVSLAFKYIIVIIYLPCSLYGSAIFRVKL